ncbi:Putative glucose-methanol-choline oxidoreductase, FAD/NAD(P)-binding domain superfamily [Colletotrichum destructivum]|uniref:Glucose-methanol-choline oxidoreductase, FAD/NAD(P)-binding domain superfamily n=1 Tax=Colletotrichum destructivum TaxID=34406 RepID=A0AAX4I2M7_9PEZI|nr:Putative glucose-methanol-choline oxidoreductase, FAD/NAD(P)-binding domain superfamily [Colletotrichum destructivum]
MRFSLVATLVTVLVDSASAFAIPWKASPKQPRHDPFIGKRAANETLDGYDYVVVGSGPGGGPVAANLAIAGFKVLLIDAGGDSGDSWTEKVPALHLMSTEFEDTRWNYFVNHYPDPEQQKRDSKMTYEMPDGSFYVGLDPPAEAKPLGVWYPRAGTLGGCSRHNALISVNAHDSDWSKIAALTGDDSWAPDNMRSYFQKLERNMYLPSSIVGHGYSGWLGTSLTSLSLVVEDQKLLSLIVAAASAMGKSLLGLLLNTVAGLGQVLLRDINAPGQTSETGLYQVPLAMTDSIRGGPRDLILDTANAVNSDGSRKYHLDIKLDTLVTKIRFDESGDKPRAVGVDFLEGSSLYRADPRSGLASPSGSGSVDAKREVIISAGAFNTPQLLKLSGIGPKAELESFDIPVLVDLPGVGTNMQDRYEATVIGKTTSDFVITSKCTFLETSPDPCLEQYQEGLEPVSKGVYATNGIAIAIVLKSSVAEDEPDLFISGAPAKFKGYFPGYASDSLADAQHWAWIVLKAHSRNNAGTVTLRSTDPRDMPAIDFNYYDAGVNGAGEADKDLQATYEGFEFSRRAFDSLLPLDGSFPEVWPGGNVTSEEDAKQFLKDEAWGHHASCTCPIGPDDDPMAVLDSSFKVRGTDGLRVVDASVFPKIPGFYIALPLYIVSEKASDVIIQEAQASAA